MNKPLSTSSDERESKPFIHPLELKLAIVCDACGSVVKASWVTREEAPRVCVKCGHSYVNAKGECRQCIDWQKHVCIFPEPEDKQ